MLTVSDKTTWLGKLRGESEIEINTAPYKYKFG